MSIARLLNGDYVLEKYEKIILKLNSVINAIDHFDIRERTGYNIQVDRDYVENLRNDVKRNKRSLNEIEVKALNEIWQTYKGKSPTSKISQHINNAIENTNNKKKKKWFERHSSQGILEESIADAKKIRELAIGQAKLAMEEASAPQMGLNGQLHRPPPPPPKPKPQGKIKKSELQEMIRDEIRKMMEEEKNKKPKRPKPRKQ